MITLPDIKEKAKKIIEKLNGDTKKKTKLVSTL